MACGGNWVLDLVRLVNSYPPESSIADITAESMGRGGCSFNLTLNLANLHEESARRSQKLAAGAQRLSCKVQNSLEVNWVALGHLDGVVPGCRLKQERVNFPKTSGPRH